MLFELAIPCCAMRVATTEADSLALVTDTLEAR